MDITNLKECPDCASSNIVHYEKKDQVICRDCGLIFEVLLPSEIERYRRAKELIPRAEMPAKPAKRKAKMAKRKAKKKKPLGKKAGRKKRR